jgi:predicted GNAT superfamily acetyltransferase
MPAEPAFTIREVAPAELDAVLEMNERAVPHVNSLSIREMRELHEQAAYFRVAEAGASGNLSAFLIGLTPEALYGSPNFLWFRRNYEAFAYIDRIAVAEDARRHGLASALYGDFERQFTARFPVLACEVNLRPSNPASMKFHLRQGFRQVGSQVIDEGKKEVAMLVKTLRA